MVSVLLSVISVAQVIPNVSFQLSEPIGLICWGMALSLAGIRLRRQPSQRTINTDSIG
jgi:hypothetical protein